MAKHDPGAVPGLDHLAMFADPVAPQGADSAATYLERPVAPRYGQRPPAPARSVRDAVLDGVGRTSESLGDGWTPPPGDRTEEFRRVPEPVVERRSPVVQGDVDWAMVRALRMEASEQLTKERQRQAKNRSDRRAAGESVEDLTPEEDLELGRMIIKGLVQDHFDSRINEGKHPTSADIKATNKAVEDAVYRLGRLQPLVDEPGIENIEILGSDVKVIYPDGRFEQRPPVADSDEELLEFLQFLATRAEGGGRTFSSYNPSLRLNLPGNIRLSAMAWTTKVPSVAIRLHRLKEITLHDLVDYQVLPTDLADILVVLIRHLSVVIAGPQGAGKTTMVRALANSLDPYERIGVAETERELFLDELPGRERVVSAEARPGGGERDGNGRPIGEYTLSDILYDFVRQNLKRVVVGEVAGPEILAMFKAMQMAEGSLSTTHATTPRGTINRLVTLAMEAGPHVTEDFAYRQIAGHINVIVQLATRYVGTGDDRRFTRFVEEVAVVEQGEDGRPALTTMYRGEPGGVGQLLTFPESIKVHLREAGFANESMQKRRI
ncbi:type II/IV secretion system protein [Rhodococcus hoagii]|nr:type II/IV secretion system protein [Prescottella equi]NKS71706.1 type II/IV secretion system protein [Prescottella equi]